MTNAVTLAATMLGIFATLGTIVGFLWWLGKPRFVEWIRSELIAPVQATHKQVSENHHDNETPTVLDRIDDVQQIATAARDAALGTRDQLNSHLLTSSKQIADGNREAVAMWEAIKAVAESDPTHEGS